LRIGETAILIPARALGLFAAPLAAEAQREKTVQRIGVLSTATQSAPPMTVRLDAFRQGLRELGYVEGDNVAFEYRSAEGNPDRLAGLAAELVRLKVDCIVTAGDTPTRAAKQATGTIPIMMANTSNPNQAGLISSLARPGGNITGLTSVSMELAGKRLGLLKEVVPKLSRVAMFWERHSSDGSLAATEGAARLLGVQLIPVEVRSLGELENAFRSVAKDRTSAVIIGWSGFFITHQARVIELAAKYRLPAIYPEQEYVPAGGLMAYATNIADLYRRAAGYVDRILKGAKPAELPVEQPTKFELVLNLKTAKALGLTIPESLLIRADEVIR
jgi:putative ABC transport system substrate-binding protein